MIERLRSYNFLEPTALVLSLFLTITLLILVLGKSIIYGLIGLSGLSIAAFIFLRDGRFFILGFFLANAFHLQYIPGLAPTDIIYLVYFGSIFLFVIFPNFLRLNIPLETPIDWLVLLFTLLLPYSMILGIVNGTSLLATVSELTFYTGFLGYYAYRPHISNRFFRIGLFVCFMLILLFVIIRNAINYRQILLQATMSWQAETARASTNEVILLSGANIFLCLGTYYKKWSYTIINTLMFTVIIGSILITRSRGYWIAFMCSFLAVLILTSRKNKMRIILIGLFLAASGFIITNLYFGNLYKLAIEGLIERFASIDLTQMDDSLKERVLESYTVLSEIARNPIAGYGVGVQYLRESLINDNHAFTTYIHNGYLAAWFKFGFLGLATLISLGVMVLKYSYQIFKRTNNTSIKAISLAIFANTIGMAAVNNTSPQFLSFDGMLMIALMSLFVTYYYQKTVLSTKFPEQRSQG